MESFLHAEYRPSKPITVGITLFQDVVLHRFPTLRRCWIIISGETGPLQTREGLAGDVLGI